MSEEIKEKSKVQVLFEAELPFWILLDDGKYEINSDGHPWMIELSNIKWRIAMDNEIDGSGQSIAIARSKEDAVKIHESIKNKKYYHKEKLRTVVATGFAWTIPGVIKTDGAKEKFQKEFNWCKNVFLNNINKLIEIYKISEPINHTPHTLNFYDLSENWWYSILLNDEWVEGGQIGYNIDTSLRKIPHLLSPEMQKVVIDRLKKGFNPPQSSLLFYNSVGLHDRGRYENAIVEVSSAFDIFLVDFLRKKFEEKKYDTELINYLISCCNNFDFMLKKGLKLAIGKSFGEIDNELLDEFKKKVLEPRNNVIHRGRKITEKEAIEAIQIVNKLINKIL